jgi:hypothetical protein
MIAQVYNIGKACHLIKTANQMDGNHKNVKFKQGFQDLYC